jgi:hypothetical protein
VPANVRRFAWLYWTSALIAIIGAPPLWVESWTARTALFQLAGVAGATLLFAAIFLPIFWFAVWRRQNWARWLLLLAFVASVPFSFLPPSEARFPLAIIGIGILSNLVEACAFYFMFTGDARPWFNRAGPESGIQKVNRLAVAAFSAVAMTSVAVADRMSYEMNRPGIVAASQQRCSKQAKRVFTAAGWPLDGSVVNDSVGQYTSHFNARLGRCLMLVAYTTNDPRDKETRKHYWVGDAFKRSKYAEYFETALPGFSTAVLQCELTIPNENPVLCHSAKEWNRLVKPYIETGALTQ